MSPKTVPTEPEVVELNACVMTHEPVILGSVVIRDSAIGLVREGSIQFDLVDKNCFTILTFGLPSSNALELAKAIIKTLQVSASELMEESPAGHNAAPPGEEQEP